MKLALASRVDGAADALEAHLDFHLGAGVDVVFLAGSADVPERLARRAGVHVLEGEASRSELARVAAEEAGADWVIESSVNEFWWPRGGSLKQVLEPVSPRYGIVHALPRDFVPVQDSAELFAERMIYRLAQQRPERRFVRRVGADGSDLTPLRGWYPIEVLRFPLEEAATASYDGEALRRGVEEGVLSVDTRLRDALRALAEGRAPDFARPDVADGARFAVDLAMLGEADLAQTRVRLDELEARLAAVESGLTEILKRKLRGLRRRG